MGRRKWKQYQDSSAQSNTSDLLEKQSPSIGEFIQFTFSLANFDV